MRTNRVDEWQTDRERYMRAADQARLARNALARTVTERNVTDAVTKSSGR
jgi:hypothetical protein